MQSAKILTRRIKFWRHISGAYITRYRFWIVTIVLLSFLTFITVSQFWHKISRHNLVSIGFVGSYNLESLPTEVLSLATQSLIRSDKMGNPVAALASHWTVADDGKTYVIFLKDNLKWHDETPVDAKDISIAISGVNITALNNKALEFKLPNPISSFPLALDKPVFKAKSFYGTGVFRIVDIDQKENIVKKISLVSKDKSLPRVDIKFYQSQDQATEALKIGEIKTARVTNAKDLQNWPNLNVEKYVDNLEIITIFYNTSDPLLASKDFRQALGYSINRSEFDGILATSPLSPDSWAYNDSAKRYEYNPGKAKGLLTKTEGGSNKIALSVSPGLEQVAESIKKDWESVGIETVLKKEKTVPSDFQVLLAVNKLSADPDQYGLWHSTQKDTNITGYKNVKIDKLLEDARNTQDQDKRKEYYFDFQKFLTEDAPAAFLYHPYRYKISYGNISSILERLPQY
ncbi:hypothetical protein A3D81_02135 [Candidatus Curtissbacteria bacterium RIFCSPHIGHO2_02_FULL_40_17]|uniref:Solute-binding protein family 5 domain-containing protein n=4 Tax=Candidatus Curtissiibacteriota TaxID=1752717 RepID=A0A1F5GH01_9BACT|nr:MAG: hypothetical protein A2693_01610 [Candidatus Curtissbacteria bacterium RIFCSPHIGHO2_01_FULL_40_12]OGD91087.1 MAG: hypothetical protein A3D81_02135 [Candidatus Curtissbacteria bacterium RIFCSPHIGHO2_02_FULL_40_17]OGE05499.1 MAG: hypothetical protein A3F45_03925 [Candidatus Curtissbacteria bacterium RIFCSPHIGHO2_12_FULL_41_17]OGE07099.1 MAG: hypothetical protein A3I53_02775 [Candidatus Curtissbacteria bacterium RIFCSPLOWO2_02_FULL_40_13b]